MCSGCFRGSARGRLPGAACNMSGKPSGEYADQPRYAKNNKLVPAAKEPERVLRESITDAVNYLAYAEDVKLPQWFDKHLGESDVFKAKLGFEQTWPVPERTFVSEPRGNIGISPTLPAGATDIREYDWVVNLQPEKFNNTATIKGNKGLYQIS